MDITYGTVLLLNPMRNQLSMLLGSNAPQLAVSSQYPSVTEPFQLTTVDASVASASAANVMLIDFIAVCRM